MSDQWMEPLVVTGVLGWRNPDECNQTQYRAYGPGGRWKRTNGGSGDAIENTLVEHGSSEGARLIVVSLDRYVPADQLQRIVDAVTEAVRANGPAAPEMTDP